MIGHGDATRGQAKGSTSLLPLPGLRVVLSASLNRARVQSVSRANALVRVSNVSVRALNFMSSMNVGCFKLSASGLNGSAPQQRVLSGFKRSVSCFLLSCRQVSRESLPSKLLYDGCSVDMLVSKLFDACDFYMNKFDKVNIPVPLSVPFSMTSYPSPPFGHNVYPTSASNASDHASPSQSATNDSSLRALAKTQNCMVHVWFTYGSTYGSRIVHVWFYVWFTYGSKPKPVWFTYGSHMVHVWFTYGSRRTGVWFTYGLQQLGQTIGGPSVNHTHRIRVCILHVWFKLKACMVHCTIGEP
jgi:hypothetical protein